MTGSPDDRDDEGKGLMRTDRPRHEAPRSRRARRSSGWSRAGLALLVIGLVAAGAVAVNNLLFGRVDGDSAPRGAPASVLPMFPDSPASGPPVNQLANPSFTRDLTGWAPTRATFASWVPDGRRGPGAIALRANPRITTGSADTTEPETVGVTTQAVRSTVAGRRVSASIWLRGTRPGTTAVLRLVERDKAREVGAQVARVSLDGGGWRQLAVDYEPHADRSSLELELTVTKLGDVAILVADDAAVLVRSA